MKPRISKDLVLFIILIPLFLWGAFFISSRMENRLPPYSVVNKARSGCSVYFEALKELGYPTGRTLKRIDEIPTDSIQIAAQNGSLDINDEKTRKWVKNGGVLVYLAPTIDLQEIGYGTLAAKDGSVKIYKYYKGTIILAKVEGITNVTLLKSTSDAYTLLEEIDKYPYKKLVFNEAHLYAPIYNKTLWDYIPMEVRYLLYQLLTILAALFYFKGKRFGKPIPLYEEVERTENEYLYSAATLYRQANCWDVMLESYYKDFLRQLGSSHEDWLEYWERERLPELGKASKVYEFMHGAGKKPKAKEYAQTVAALEQLKAILKKRRDSYWKTLKRTM